GLEHRNPVEWWRLWTGRKPAYPFCAALVSLVFMEGTSNGAETLSTAGGRSGGRVKLLRTISLLMILAGMIYAEKITDEDRLRLIRGLTAEFGTAKIALPRSKKPLEVNTTGEILKANWDKAFQERGEAAKVGDQIQFTKVTIN